MKTRIKNILIIIVVSLIYSCTTSNQQENTISSKMYWGFKHSYKDTLHYQIINSTRDCFPGFNEFENDYKQVDMKVFNLKGEQVYQSISLSENWICKGHQDSNNKAGIYFFQLIFTTNQKPIKVDTIIGQFHLIEQSVFMEE